MMKFEENRDDSKVNEFIESIQKRVPDIDVDITNVNDVMVMLEERDNCAGCKSLDECKNENKGFCTKYTNGTFSICPCKYKKDKNNEASKQSLIKTLYLPETILNARLECFDADTESRAKVYKKIVDFVEGFGNEPQKGLYIFGTFSIGKTYALGCAANELAKKNIKSLLIYFPDLVIDLKNALNTPRYEQMINMLKSIDVLMLDDLGSENMTAWVRDEILGPILNYRVLEHKPLFVSSNISPTDLKAHLAIDKNPASVMKAERILSRMNGLMSSISFDAAKKYNR